MKSIGRCYRKIYLKTLRIFVCFMGMPIVNEANKVIDK